MATTSVPRIGLVLSTAVDADPEEFVEIGRRAEELGYAAALVNEGRGDALACAQAIAARTERIQVGTNIANAYFRHPFLAAMTAKTITDLYGGRLLLGVGISHRVLLETIGIEMGDARSYLRDYVGKLQEFLAGQSESPFYRPAAATRRVPVYAAGLTEETARIAGELADGLMPFLPTRGYLSELVAAARSAARERGRDETKFDCIMSIPTFLSDDVEAACNAARYNLAFFAQLPNYRRQWRRSGFRAEMDQLREHWAGGGGRREAAALVPDALVDQVCVYGPAEQCREQLAAFHQAGADMPVLAVSPVNEKRLPATREALVALAP